MTRITFPALANPDRLAALEATDLMDSPAEREFDRVTDLVRRCLDVPVALVSLVGEARQFFKSEQGLGEPWCSTRETPLSHSFCQYVVADDGPLVVDDARKHPVLQHNEAVEDLSVVAYLGVPLRTPDGHTLGSLCAIDSVPRRWSGSDVEAMEAMAEVVMATIAHRYRALPEPAGSLFAALSGALPYAVAVLDARGYVLAANASARVLADVPARAVAGQMLPDVLPVYGEAAARLRQALSRAAAGEAVRYDEAEMEGPARVFAVSLRPLRSSYLLFEAKEHPKAA